MENQYYRTFMGLPLRVDQSFLRARDRLMEVLEEERISWTQPGQYHVTLRFIGDTELSAINGISSALRNEIPVRRQIRLELNGLDSFGPRKSPRVLWVGFENNSFFQLLKQDVDRVLASCGIRLEDQVFRAHLTLGRVRSLKNLRKYYDTVEALQHHFRGPVLFDRLVFFRSILGRQGPEYHVLEELLFSPG